MTTRVRKITVIFLPLNTQVPLDLIRHRDVMFYKKN